jgi:hypothetical protein
MKHVLIATFVLVLFASSVFAADFVPQKMTFSMSEAIQYAFDGSELTIPVTVTGTPALATFMVYTKDMADAVAPLQNGYLGWHFVNKVDTCIYMSAPIQLSTGSNDITWMGVDNDGGTVPAGEYTYYLWGFDNVSARYVATSVMKPGQNAQILEKAEDGTALANPVYVNGRNRWVIGSDPDDASFQETAAISMPEGWGLKNHYGIDPADWDHIYYPAMNKDALTGGIWHFLWVPNGECELVADWGDGGSVTWTQPQFYHMNATTDGQYVYATANTYKEESVHNELWVVDIAEGELSVELDISDHWGDPDDYEAGAQMNGGPGTMTQRDHLLFLGCHCSCMREVLDPLRGMDEEDDLIVYVNNNGDYVLDHNFEEDADKPWVCNDFNVGPYTYTFYSDAEYFALCPSFDVGALSFGLLAPDGTGIGYFAFAGETAQQKSGVLICDNGSAFDGLYTSSNEGLESGTNPETYYAAHDVVSGIISSQPQAVAEDAAAFDVSQNSPNPFNPTTTISFNTADAGIVAIDVFNVAGQKVDTIANEFMSAGSHSVTWDATGFSAGVYFYTVKSGDFSKTMKMTLLK